MFQSQMKQPPNLDLLIKLMKMTTSATDGEALAAIRFANQLLSKLGGDWEDLLRGKLATIDPFASLPEPPKAAPKTTTSSYSGGFSAAKPAYQPPPPVYFGLDKKEAKDITTWLVACEFASLDSYVQRQINHIETRWRTNKKLDQTDYELLRRTAQGVRKRRP